MPVCRVDHAERQSVFHKDFNPEVLLGLLSLFEDSVPLLRCEDIFRIAAARVSHGEDAMELYVPHVRSGSDEPLGYIVQFLVIFWSAVELYGEWNAAI